MRTADCTVDGTIFRTIFTTCGWPPLADSEITRSSYYKATFRTLAVVVNVWLPVECKVFHLLFSETHTSSSNRAFTHPEVIPVRR